MDEQVGWPYQQEGVFIQRRRAAPPQIPASTPTRRQVVQTDEDEEEGIYPARPPSSARRYVDTRGNQVIRQGNRQIVIHEKRHSLRRFHWMLFMGLTMFIMIIGWMLLTAASYWWQQRQDDWKYGSPFRTYQVDQFVGHGDSPDHPDPFIAVNAGGVIQVVELNPLQPKYDHVYPITTVNDSTTPVTIGFEDVNHDGKVDMLVTIGDSNSYTVTLMNTGSQFTR